MSTTRFLSRARRKFEAVAERVRVVLVDDAAEVRQVVAMQLSVTEQFEVVGEGATGRDAIELVRQLTPDLLLLDVSMPDMDGLEALPAVAQASPETRVVMFSGFAAH